MTACIVGWAHTSSAGSKARPLESLIVRVAGEALADAGIAPGDVDEILLGHFNAGFSAQDFTASLVLQASPELALQARHAGRKRLRHRIGRGASGHQGDRSKIRAHRAGGRRRADDHDAGGRDRPQPAQGLLRARRGRHRGRLRGHLRQDRGTLFPALGRPVGCARPHRREESQERRRQSVRPDPQGPGLRVLPHREREEPARRRAAQAHRLLARLRRRRRGRAGGRRHRRCRLGKAVAFRAAEHVQDFLPMSKRDVLKFEGCSEGLAARARAVPASRYPICPSSRRTTASPSPS